MLAVSISVPAHERTIHVAVADHVPVAELIPHLVEQEAEVAVGQHWVLSRSVETIRPEHSLADAGVRPGELLTLDVAKVPQPKAEAVDELSGPIGSNPAVWIGAGIAAVFTWQSSPLFHPLDHHELDSFGLGGTNGGGESLLLVLLTLMAALGSAAGSLFDKRYSYLAAILGFGLGLHVNVLCACACAALMVWCRGPARVFTVTLAIFAAINVLPGLTLLLALVALTYSGQISIAVARINLPKVPATGLFQEPVKSSSGSVIDVHSTLVLALCTVIAASYYQLVPWGSSPNWWIVALGVVIALTSVSARGARPIHACAVVTLGALVSLWLALHVSVGAIVLVFLAIPAITVRSPMAGRVVDAIEGLSFAAAIPLALHSTGLFDLIRGIG